MVYRDRARPTGTAADDRARVRGVHLGRTGHDPCTVDGRRTRGRARRTNGPGGGGGGGPHSSSWARARPGWTSRTGRRAKGSNAGGGARRYGCETREGATRSGDERTGARARWGVRTGRMDDDGRVGGVRRGGRGRGLVARDVGGGGRARGCETDERGARRTQITAHLVRELEREARRRNGEAPVAVDEDEADVRGGDGGGRAASTSTARSGGVSTSTARSGARGRGGAAATPRGLFAPADLLTASHVTPNHRELAEEPSAKHPDLREALRQSARVGDLLLKREAREIEEIDKYAEELEKLEKDPFAGAREAPCGVEAEKVRACYGSNAKNVTACREVVDEYKKCGRVALRKFVQREPAAA